MVETQDSGTQDSGDQLSPGKRRVFTLITLLFPVFLFLVLEGGLRLTGVGDAYPLFVEADSSGTHLRMNPRVSERYFYGDFTAPGATYDPFRSTKRPATLRILVQGASTTLGFPFFYGAAFPRILEWWLQEALPQREVEVVNTALTAVNTHTLLDFADEIVEQDPDLILVYAGHNEYYGAFGVASTRAGGNTRWVRTYLALRQLRMVQLMSAAFHWLGGTLTPGEVDRGGTVMERMVGQRTIPLGSQLYREGLGQMEANLDALLSRYAEAGIPVYIGTLVSNEKDQLPFISREDPSVPLEEWESTLALARQALERGEVAEALEALESPASRDSLNAVAFFGAAALLDSAGVYGEARELYLAAKDRDLLRFRAPEAINRIIREQAAAHGATVVEVRRALRDASQNSIVGGSLITEHVHPTIRGYALMAHAFLRALEGTGALGAGIHVPSWEEAWRDIPVTVVDSLYGAFLLRSLKAGWPFQDDPEVEARILQELRSMRGEDPVEALALELFRGQISWPAAMLQLFDHFRRSGDPARARHVARVLAQELPLSGRPLELLAHLAVDADSLGRALEYLERAWEVEPAVGTAMLSGSLLLRQGRHEEAIEAFGRGVRLTPSGDSGPRAVLEAARALPELQRRVQERPENADALFDLAFAYLATNLTEEARATAERLLEVEPGSQRAQQILAQLAPFAPAGGPPLPAP